MMKKRYTPPSSCSLSPRESTRGTTLVESSRSNSIEPIEASSRCVNMRLPDLVRRGTSSNLPSMAASRSSRSPWDKVSRRCKPAIITNEGSYASRELWNNSRVVILALVSSRVMMKRLARGAVKLPHVVPLAYL